MCKSESSVEASYLCRIRFVYIYIYNICKVICGSMEVSNLCACNSVTRVK